MPLRLRNTGGAWGLAELVMGNPAELTFDTGFFSAETNKRQGIERKLSLGNKTKKQTKKKKKEKSLQKGDI